MYLADHGVLIVSKVISFLSNILNFGAGATWPGEIALKINPSILNTLSKQLKKGIIIVAGTNGKTTTALMIKTILEKNGDRVIHNTSGANLINGVVSAFITHAGWNGNVEADWGVFEVDENSLPIVISDLPIDQFTNQGKKLIIILLNLFRDQLDRYGEVDMIVEKWQKAIQKLPSSTTFILNSDDPGIAHFGKAVNSRPGLGRAAFYFGIEDSSLYQKQMEHATDSIFCFNCGSRLVYKGVYYSHIGIWHCPNCKEARPRPTVTKWQSPLPGLYNRYNTLAAVSSAKALGVDDKTIKTGLENFTPAFGRQEEFLLEGKKIKLFLSKNPAGFNASLHTVLEMNPKVLLLVLNDRIPDGRDVSWIWDVDFEILMQSEHMTKERDQRVIIVSGDRCYDLAVRMKYARESQKSPLRPSLRDFAGQAKIRRPHLIVEENLQMAVKLGLGRINKEETLFVLPTYSAMLEVRKFLRGRSIL